MQALNWETAENGMLGMIASAISQMKPWSPTTGYTIVRTTMIPIPATLWLIGMVIVRVLECSLGRVTSGTHISVCNIIVMWQAHVLGYYYLKSLSCGRLL